MSVVIRTGSSPLTRGKRTHGVGVGAVDGLIPAHAGKTVRPLSSAVAAEAHPRSRGENHVTMLRWAMRAGSSPLTRGKLRYRGKRWSFQRLIPAHAGKTMTVRENLCRNAAHPRSRGENSTTRPLSRHQTGSSPLTRGKRVAGRPQLGADRLIPAHAGKTLPDLRFYCADRSDLGNP